MNSLSGAHKVKAFVHTKNARSDGTFDCYLTQEVPVKTSHVPRKGQTLCGYGRAIPTAYLVFYNGRWHRVKVCIFSNSGTAYIGKLYSPCLTVDIEHN